ncbi:prepilin-type N-terminal cleavage/methylation domain-containing protein [Aeromonas taiwanensis]|uniref:Prepilin-type N-terminal cleavage/methylation domain-containing protein n=1 Tax=Aeromonas taiwanensis TaxID=633417 RepID=A0A5F0KED9_9GAMM|nr:prepilin-type N-terminal cleavage/methylation domain-containing protein [Aeromonas taiwanensis]TFF79568.1 prepilin-type N-terminal cleavage/methylation domain-containing protein [Aeromonas taiwanensis]TFF80569.1 prepilin-type N-terminal cleavage/methylation domain-containing protein [Aeromonas taiwanensis]TFF82837.1 prepilin-type N-terminal cleavage/methylation domain-containing protein [Aeromonas taiwanensis]
MNKQKGFGLLEILITLVLLGVGVAGLVSLARGMLSTAREGGRYEIAMRLAESKLDEFRNFNEVRTSTPPLTAYKDIATGSGSQSLSNDSYSVNWTVTNQFLNSGVWSTTQPATYLYDYPERKRIVVRVTWNDNDGSGRYLELAGAISPTGSFTSDETGDGLVKPRENPIVDYTKGSVPDVVAVALGNGSNKETSKPLPHISGGSSSSRTIQFDTATYQTIGSGSQRQSVQDTATVYCSCTFSGGTGTAYLPARPYYIESDDLQYWKSGTQLSKSVGGLKGNANQQETLCSTCCREHYDVSTQGFAGYYAPLNTSRGRYQTSGSSLVAASTGDYMDACRFIRIDGFYRPAPDWRLASLTSFSASFLNDATNLANYQAYVAYVVTEHAKWQKTAFAGTTDSSWSVPNSSPAIQSFNSWLAANRAGDSTTALSTSIGSRQLISRGIYVDIMPPSYLSDEVFKGGVTEPILAKITFQDVNMTLLSEWSSSDANKGTVTSQPIATIVDPDNNYYGTYSRGVLTAKSTTFSGTPPVDSPITITVKSYQGNSGVVGSPVLPEDVTAAMTSTMLVSIQNQPVTSIHGIVECLQLKTTGNGNGLKNSSVSCDATSIGLTVGVNNANVTCQVLDLGKPAKPNYSCSGVPGSSFTLTLSKSGYQITPASQTFTLPASGTSVGGCVMMVQETLLTASPAATPTPTTTCTTVP